MTYRELVEFCGDERKAYFLSRHLPYQDLNETALTEMVADLMVRAKERQSGPIQIELLGGQNFAYRRDKQRRLR